MPPNEDTPVQDAPAGYTYQGNNLVSSVTNNADSSGGPAGSSSGQPGSGAGGGPGGGSVSSGAGGGGHQQTDSGGSPGDSSGQPGNSGGYSGGQSRSGSSQVASPSPAASPVAAPQSTPPTATPDAAPIQPAMTLVNGQMTPTGGWVQGDQLIGTPPSQVYSQRLKNQQIAVATQPQAVSAYQTKLSQTPSLQTGRPYYQGQIDGNASSGDTISAIVNFQHDNGLTPDGLIGVSPYGETGPAIDKAHALAQRAVYSGGSLGPASPAPTPPSQALQQAAAITPDVSPVGIPGPNAQKDINTDATRIAAAAMVPPDQPAQGWSASQQPMTAAETRQTAQQMNPEPPAAAAPLAAEPPVTFTPHVATPADNVEVGKGGAGPDRPPTGAQSGQAPGLNTPGSQAALDQAIAAAARPNQGPESAPGGNIGATPAAAPVPAAAPPAAGARPDFTEASGSPNAGVSPALQGAIGAASAPPGVPPAVPAPPTPPAAGPPLPGSATSTPKKPPAPPSPAAGALAAAGQASNPTAAAQRMGNANMPGAGMPQGYVGGPPTDTNAGAAAAAMGAGTALPAATPAAGPAATSTAASVSGADPYGNPPSSWYRPDYQDQFQPLANAAADKYGVPREVMNAVIYHESGWDPSRVSPTGAVGVTQLMPGTAQELGVNPRDPAQNIDGGARYLAQQYATFGDWSKALAAYNAGPGNIKAGTQYANDVLALTTKGPGFAGAGGGGSPGPQVAGGSPAAAPAPVSPATPASLNLGPPPTRVDPAAAMPAIANAVNGLQTPPPPPPQPATRAYQGAVAAGGGAPPVTPAQPASITRGINPPSAQTYPSAVAAGGAPPAPPSLPGYQPGLGSPIGYGDMSSGKDYAPGAGPVTMPVVAPSVNFSEASGSPTFMQTGMSEPMVKAAGEQAGLKNWQSQFPDATPAGYKAYQDAQRAAAAQGPQTPPAQAAQPGAGMTRGDIGAGALPAQGAAVAPTTPPAAPASGAPSAAATPTDHAADMLGLPRTSDAGGGQQAAPGGAQVASATPQDIQPAIQELQQTIAAASPDQQKAVMDHVAVTASLANQVASAPPEQKVQAWNNALDQLAQRGLISQNDRNQHYGQPDDQMVQHAIALGQALQMAA